MSRVLEGTEADGLAGGRRTEERERGVEEERDDSGEGEDEDRMRLKRVRMS